jgi:hypothetical protein
MRTPKLFGTSDESPAGTLRFVPVSSKGHKTPQGSDNFPKNRINLKWAKFQKNFSYI